jgi:hypothetical protein
MSTVFAMQQKLGPSLTQKMSLSFLPLRWTFLSFLLFGGAILFSSCDNITTWMLLFILRDCFMCSDFSLQLLFSTILLNILSQLIYIYFNFMTFLIKATERLNAYQASVARNQNYMAMYSSIFGGITTDLSAMVIPIDDHMVHRGHGVFDTAAIMDG